MTRSETVSKMAVRIEAGCAAWLAATACVSGAARPALAAPPLPAGGDVGIDEHLGRALPGELRFTDERGASVRLADALAGGQPVLLTLAYFRCPMLCDLVLQGLASGVPRAGLRLGRDYRALTVSIDPLDTPGGASLKQRSLLQAAGQLDAVAAWPFLVGREREIHALAGALGFRYVHDPKSGQYAHPAAVFVLSPDGKVARVLTGVRFRPVDLRLALLEAARGKIGGVVDRVLLTCFRYDPSSRRYAIYVTGVMKGGGALVVAALGATLALLWRRERRRGGPA